MIPMGTYPVHSIKVAEGANVPLICYTRTYDSRNLKWYRRTGRTDKEFKTSLVRRDQIHAGAWHAEISVTIKSATKSDSGIYVCKRLLKHLGHTKEVTVNVIVDEGECHSNFNSCLSSNVMNS